jgi:hypothetical protein
MLKVTATIAFVMFGAMSSYAVWDIGFGWAGVSVVVLMIGAFLFEMWVVSARADKHTMNILSSIAGYIGKPVETPKNIMEATDTIRMLENDLKIVVNAYMELCDGACPHPSTHVVAGEGDDRVERCVRCGGQIVYGKPELMFGGFEPEPLSEGLYRPYGVVYDYENTDINLRNRRRPGDKEDWDEDLWSL